MEPIENSAYLPALKSVDYQHIIENPQLVKMNLDRYLLIRANLVLGKYREARMILSDCAKNLGERTFLLQFLAVQIDIYERNHLQECCLKLTELMGAIPQSDYYRGEFHFVSGYLYCLLDEYKQGTRYHRLAADHYRMVGLPGHESTALFNLCLSYNHLNERALFKQTLKQLEQLAGECPMPATEHSYFRMLANHEMDNDNYAIAIGHLEKAGEIYESAQRWRDLGAIYCCQVYSFMKLKRDNNFWDLFDRIKRVFLHLTHEHRLVLNEMKILFEMGLVDGTRARRLLARWKRTKFYSGNHLLLLSLLLDQIQKGGDYELLVRLAHQCSQFSLKHQQALRLVDFRSYEIVGLIRIGQLERARRLLNSYKQDANDFGSVSKLAKAEALEETIQAAESASVQLKLTPNAREELVLNTASHVISVCGRGVDLTMTPLVEKFLAILLGQNGLVAISSVFERVYQNSYNPILHERRFNSLIDRSRRILGETNIIVRTDGKIGIHPRYAKRVMARRSKEYSIQQRRGQLVELIRSAKKSISIADLENLFDCTRRTLQMDLKHLIDARMVCADGDTHNRCYQIEGIR